MSVKPFATRHRATSHLARVMVIDRENRRKLNKELSSVIAHANVSHPTKAQDHMQRLNDLMRRLIGGP